MTLKNVALVALLIPACSMAASPFAGTWTIQPELTTFDDLDHPLELMIERGNYRRTGCGAPIEVAADGAEHPVVQQPLLDTMSVRLVNPRRVQIVQKMAGKVTWKGDYAVSKDLRSMSLDFEDERAAAPVTGTIQFSRVGDPLSGAHSLSGSWRSDKLTRLSASASTMTIEDREPGLAIRWSDGRSVVSRLDAKYYPLDGYLSGAQASILNPRPDTLAINREQGVVPVEVSRAVISVDGQTLTYRQDDWVCRGLTTFIYHKSPAP